MNISYVSIISIVIAVATPLAEAKIWTSRAEAGLGLTDNANLSSANEESDLFLRLGSGNSWKLGQHRAQLRLFYKDYFKENENDVFSWKLSDEWNPGPLIRGWSYSGALFGHHYTKSSPGYTDESFSNMGLEARAEREIQMSSRSLFFWGPRYEFRSYAGSGKRTDQTLALHGMIEFNATSRVTIEGFTELGWLVSNRSDYRSVFFELGGMVDYDFMRGWSWNTELSYRKTNFMDRTISEDTASTRARGRKARAGLQTKESYSTLALSSEIRHALTRSLQAGGELSYRKQDSESGLQDYDALEIFGRLIWTF